MKKKVFIYIHTKDRTLAECNKVFDRVINTLKISNPEEFNNVEFNSLGDLYMFTNNDRLEDQAIALKNIYIAFKTSSICVDVHADYTSDYELFDRVFYTLTRDRKVDDSITRVELSPYLVDKEYCELLRKKYEEARVENGDCCSPRPF